MTREGIVDRDQAVERRAALNLFILGFRRRVGLREFSAECSGLYAGDV